MTQILDASPMEITNSRIFDSSQATLFDAFADPEKLKIWWGPDGFTNTIHTFDLHEGGTWHFTMHAFNGVDFENTSTFIEISTPQRVAFIHHLPMHVFTMTMSYDVVENGTKLTWHMLFDPAENNHALKDFIAAANEQNFDRLAEFIHSESTGAQS